MTALAGWPIRHPAAALGVLVVLAVAGVAFAPWLAPQRLAPVPDAGVRIEVELPGVDAAQIESAIVRPLEDSFASLPALQRISSRSSEGLAEIKLQFSSAAGREAAHAQVRERLATAALPPGTETPLIELDEPALAPALVYAITGEPLSGEIAQWTEQSLRRPLQEIADTASVTLDGVEQTEILVQPNQQRMATLGLSFDDLIQALRGRDEAAQRRSARRTSAARPAAIEAIAVRAVRLPSGEPIALADVTEVSLLRKPVVDYPRYRGEPVLLLHVYPVSALYAPTVAERANAHLAWLRANGQIPATVQVHSLFDESIATRQWRRQMLQRIGAGVAVALAAVWLFFGFRQALIMLALFAVCLPLAAAVLWMIGFTFNTMTALGLMLACVALMLTSAYSLSLRAFVAKTIIATGLLAVASYWLPFLRQVNVAFVIAVVIGGVTCWLLSPWFVPQAKPVAGLAHLLPMAWRAWAGVLTALFVAVTIFVAVMFRVPVPPPVIEGAADLALTVRVWGNEEQHVADLARRVSSQLQTISSLTDVTYSTAARQQWRLQLDTPSLEASGVTLAEVGRAFAIARHGLIIDSGLDGQTRISLRLKLAPDAAGATFERLLLRGEQKKRAALYLRDVATVWRVNAPSEQLRIQRMPAAEIRARLPSLPIPAEVNRLRESVPVPTDYSLEWSVSAVASTR